VDIYPQLNKAFSGGNAVNVASAVHRHIDRITWVGDDDYGTKLKQDLARMGVDIYPQLNKAFSGGNAVNVASAVHR
ncbi:hypothetical protein PSX78_23565, partial [Shigella flexneri]|nr:hypothetical protein [Shigella flexneri]